MQKTKVYRWRLSPHLKKALEEAARNQRKPLAALLEEIAEEWLRRATASGSDEEQERLRAVALPLVGALASGQPDRAEKVRSGVRDSIAGKNRGAAFLQCIDELKHRYGEGVNDFEPARLDIVPAQPFARRGKRD